MSAEIIQFIRRPHRDREQTDFPTIAFRSVLCHADLTMHHVDTAPCEYLSSDHDPASSDLRGMRPATE
jgi:hypothetical protein